MYTEEFGAIVGLIVPALCCSGAVLCRMLNGRGLWRDGNPDGMWRLQTCRYDVMCRVCAHMEDCEILHSMLVGSNLCTSVYVPCEPCKYMRVLLFMSVFMTICVAISSANMSCLALIITLKQQEVGSVCGWKD